MIGAIIGAAAGIGSAIAGGIKAAKAARRQKAQLEREKAENAAWYERRYNEDATQRADAQRLLRQTQDSIRNRNREAASTQAVVGGTEESVAATKEANAKALSDTASAIAAQGETRKGQVEESYRNQDRTINKELGEIEANRAKNIANTSAQAISAMGTLANAIDSKPQVNKLQVNNADNQQFAREMSQTKQLGDNLANKIADDYIKQINGATL